MALCALLPGLALNQEVPFAITHSFCVCVCERVCADRTVAGDAAEVKRTLNSRCLHIMIPTRKCKAQQHFPCLSSVLWDQRYSLELHSLPVMKVTSGSLAATRSCGLFLKWEITEKPMIYINTRFGLKRTDFRVS